MKMSYNHSVVNQDSDITAGMSVPCFYPSQAIQYIVELEDVSGLNSISNLVHTEKHFNNLSKEIGNYIKKAHSKRVLVHICIYIYVL